MYGKWLSLVPKSLLTNGKENMLNELINYFFPKIEQLLFIQDIFMFSLANISKHWLFMSFLRVFESLLMENLS